MKKRITLATFRRMAAAEAQMISGAMPRTPGELPRFHGDPAPVNNAGGRLVARPLTVKMAEVADVR